MEFESIVWVLRSIATGALAYLGKRILEGSNNKLEELRKKPLNSTNQDLEELLGHLSEEIGSLEELEIRDSIRILRIRFGVSRAYWLIVIDDLASEKGKPGGV